MVQAPVKAITLAEFLQLPETKPASEYSDGRIFQKPVPQGKHSVLQGEIVSNFSGTLKQGKVAYGFPELRCTFGGRSVVPDVVVLLWANIPLDEDGEVANGVNRVPDWVVEILSPQQSPTQVVKNISMRKKVRSSHNCTMVKAGVRAAAFPGSATKRSRNSLRCCTPHGSTLMQHLSNQRYYLSSSPIPPSQSVPNSDLCTRLSTSNSPPPSASVTNSPPAFASANTAMANMN
ncbi:MAG: Uma2 family endonuclease [Synechococcales cyanobacterium RM1_1_8]|nr:Uma2 family endonuclease [Synechococcales cyanobacterium RM1_1_8]